MEHRFVERDRDQGVEGLWFASMALLARAAALLALYGAWILVSC